MAFRLIFAGAVLLSALAAPWWVTVALALVALINADAWEIIPIALIHDLAFAAPAPGIAGFPFLLTLLFAVLFALSWYGRRRLLVYTDE